MCDKRMYSKGINSSTEKFDYKKLNGDCKIRRKNKLGNGDK